MAIRMPIWRVRSSTAVTIVLTMPSAATTSAISPTEASTPFQARKVRRISPNRSRKLTTPYPSARSVALTRSTSCTRRTRTNKPAAAPNRRPRRRRPYAALEAVQPVEDAAERERAHPRGGLLRDVGGARGGPVEEVLPPDADDAEGELGAGEHVGRRRLAPGAQDRQDVPQVHAGGDHLHFPADRLRRVPHPEPQQHAVGEDQLARRRAAEEAACQQAVEGRESADAGGHGRAATYSASPPRGAAAPARSRPARPGRPRGPPAAAPAPPRRAPPRHPRPRRPGRRGPAAPAAA